MSRLTGTFPKVPLTDVVDDLLHQANGKLDRKRKFAIGGQMSVASIIADGGVTIQLKTGKHYRLIKVLIEEFIPHFVPASKILYVGDTGKKWGYFDEAGLAALGVKMNIHGKMPDVVIHYPAKNWILLIEAVTSHGPVNAKRREELAQLFAASTAGAVYVTAFPTRADMTRYLTDISWEIEVWIAEAPTHLIHFNGERFLGPWPV